MPVHRFAFYKPLHIVPTDDESAEVQVRKGRDDLERMQEAIRLKEKIFLLLNPKEAEHVELCRLVQIAFDAYAACGEMVEPLCRVREFSQGVLKKEWNVVKS